MLEHEAHHRGQMYVYLKDSGRGGASAVYVE
jgi:uncharacterized damage-inducible protein DinB